MLKTIQKIKENFPEDVDIPIGVKKLCDFFDINGYPISGNFELNFIGKQSMNAYFKDEQESVSKFAVFGNSGDGSDYALWLHRGLDSEIAPVVLMDSEGVNNLILADNSIDFLKLLAIGYEELGYESLIEPPADPGNAMILRAWLEKSMNLNIPKNGKK